MAEDGISLRDSGTFRSTYNLDPDSVQGFETAVRNNQTRLALEYAVNVIAKLREDVDALRNELGALKVAKTPSAPRKAKDEKPAKEDDAAGQS